MNDAVPERIAITSLAGWTHAACATGTAGAYGLCLTFDWAPAREGVRSAMIGGLAVLAAGLLGFAIVAAANRRAPRHLPSAIFAAGAARLILSLVLGLAFFFIAAPEGRTMWTAFLGSGLLWLIAETGWALGAARRMPGYAPSGALRTGASA
jgi:hypothetical protein